jgi:DNA replication and repair protein RecF
MLLLRDLQIKNFRNLNSLSLSFQEQVTVIKGNNGSGKTSILEAIHFLSTGKSFRSSNTTNLINYHHNSFLISASNSNNDVFFIEKKKSGEKYFRINNTVCTLLSAYKLLPTTMIQQNEDRKLAGTNSQRWQILEKGMFLHNIDLANKISLNKKLHQHRQLLLQDHHKHNLQYLDVIEEAIVDNSLKIDIFRKNYIALLQEELNHMYSEFHNIEMQYYSGWPNEESLKICLEKSRKYDSEFPDKYGCHRVSLDLKKNGTSIYEFLSRGEQKIILYLLKIAQTLISQYSKNDYIYLVDDPGAELDKNSMDIILKYLLNDGKQIIFTDLPHHSILVDRLRYHNYLFQYLSLEHLLNEGKRELL